MLSYWSCKMSLLGYVLLLTAALCCTAAPAPDEILCSAYSLVPNGKLIATKPSYKYEEEIDVKCDDGYKLQQSIPKCTAKGWSPPPICVTKNCDKPDIKHGYLYINYYFPRILRSSLYYRCEKNFLSHERNYYGTITCTNTGWDPEPTCSQFYCTISDIVNLIRKPLKQLYPENYQVSLDCDKGFIRIGPNITTCTENGWNPPLPTCEIGEQCGPPPVIQYGDTISFNKPVYNSTESVEYKCPEYYILQGNKIVRCLNGVWEEAPVCLEPCTVKEKDIEDNKIKLRFKDAKKHYSTHGDTMEFTCLLGYEAPPGTQMRRTCEHGKLQYPKCFKTGFCVLDQSTMIIHNIHYNVSTIVDNGQTVTFQCIEGAISKNKLEVTCESGRIKYPKCTVASPCKISTEDLNLYNIQLLPSDVPENNPDITYRHGTQLSVTCKSGFRQPTEAALAIECYDGEFRYPRCFAGKTCRIDQDELDRNNLELDEVHDNEIFYEENERVHFKCKNGYYRRTKLFGKCSNETLTYPSCTAQSLG